MLFGAVADILKEQGPLMLSKLQHIQMACGISLKSSSTNDPRDSAGPQK